MASRHKVGV